MSGGLQEVQKIWSTTDALDVAALGSDLQGIFITVVDCDGGRDLDLPVKQAPPRASRRSSTWSSELDAWPLKSAGWLQRVPSP
jgi:hypothetical protein